MLSFEDVLKEFDIFLQTASYLEVLPCRWGYVRLFNEGDVNVNEYLSHVTANI